MISRRVVVPVIGRINGFGLFVRSALNEWTLLLGVLWGLHAAPGTSQLGWNNSGNYMVWCIKTALKGFLVFFLDVQRPGHY